MQPFQCSWYITRLSLFSAMHGFQITSSDKHQVKEKVREKEYVKQRIINGKFMVDGTKPKIHRKSYIANGVLLSGNEKLKAWTLTLQSAWYMSAKNNSLKLTSIDRRQLYIILL